MSKNTTTIVMPVSLLEDLRRIGENHFKTDTFPHYAAIQHIVENYED